METTWRARPVLTARLTFALLIMMLVLALVGGAVIVGSQLTSQFAPDRGALLIPQGGEAVLAFGYFEPGANEADIYTIRADGTDRRQVTADPADGTPLMDDTDPIWSPDGTRLAFWSLKGGAGGPFTLRVADASGVTTLAEGIGCFPISLTPVWSPDGRFIVYPVTRTNGAPCADDNNDLFIIPADGSAAGQRLLASAFTGFSGYAAWSPSGARIAFGGTDDTGSGLWVADVPDPAAPFGLDAHRIDDPGSYLSGSWYWQRWSPDETLIASTVALPGSETDSAVVVAADGSGTTAVLWPGSDYNLAPEWSPSGSRLSILRLNGPGIDATDGYEGYLVDPDGSNRQQVMAPPLSGNWAGLAFSPDGTRVIGRSPATETTIGSPRDLIMMTLDGSAAPVMIPAMGFSLASWQPVVAPLFGTPAPLGSPTPDGSGTP